MIGDSTRDSDIEPAGDRPLVLVAEDEPLASMALRAQLEALDYRVLGPARNGDEAVDLGACHPVDVALFDVRMPGRSGLQAASDLFTLAPTPVVLLTGVGVSELPDPLSRPPIFGVLSKPAGLDEMAAALATAGSRFREWLQEEGDSGADGLTRAQRALIARAIRAFGGEERPATAAARLLERARTERRSPADVARHILDSAPS